MIDANTKMAGDAAGRITREEESMVHHPCVDGCRRSRTRVLVIVIAAFAVVAVAAIIASVSTSSSASHGNPLRRNLQHFNEDPKTVNLKMEESVNKMIATDGGLSFFGDDSRVHILQIGNEPYRTKYQEKIDQNRNWAESAGYMHHFRYLDEAFLEPCVYTKKVKAIRDFFRDELPANDWMIFVDLDAVYSPSDAKALDKLLWGAQQTHYYNGITEHHCEVIAQTSLRTINSGILILKHTEQVRALIDGWFKLQVEHGFCGGPADQLALQETVLDHYDIGGYASLLDDKKCVQYEHDVYTARQGCSMSKLNAKRAENLNALTYRDTRLGYYSLPVGNNVCFFDCNSRRVLQCHDCCMNCRPQVEHSVDMCKEKRPLFAHQRIK
jgi:hypothetical protein